MSELLVAVSQAAVTTVAATALGSWILPARFTFHHGALGWAVQTAVGFLVIAYTLFALAQAHLTSRDHLKGVFAAVAVVALIWVMRAAWRGGWSRTDAVAWVAAAQRADPMVRLVAAAAVGYAFWIVLCATLPAAASDELIHHLAAPKAMLEAGGAVVFLDNIYAYFPPLGEMLFLFGLGVGGEVAARLFHAACGVVLAAALFGFSRRFLPASSAVWPVVLFFTVPSVMVILPWAYVDVMFTLYAFLALVLLLEFFESRKSEWVVLVAVMAGGALATKYTGLQLLMILVLLVLGEHLVARRAGAPTAVLVLGGVVTLITAPFLWRNWDVTGWPLFPFPIGPFSLRPEINWDLDRASLFLSLLATYGTSAAPLSLAGVWTWLAAPVLVFLTASFDDPRAYDGIVGPVFLLTPLALWRRQARQGLGVLCVFALLFLLYWGVSVRQVRFLIPVLPVLSVLLIVGLERRGSVTGRRKSPAPYVGVALCVAVSVVMGAKHALDQEPFRFWTGAESREEFLTRRVAGYAIYQAANQRLGVGDRLLLVNMRSYGYYLKPEWRADFVFELYSLERHLSGSQDPRDLSDFFASRAITHVLIDDRPTFSDAVLGPEQRGVLRAFLDERATVLAQVGTQVLYRLE